MKRTEVALFVNGKPIRGVLEQFEATDQTFITSGDADATTSTLNFTNSTGGTFTVSNSALLFNDAFVTSGVLDANTGTVTFTNSSGGTFNVTGFEGFTSYWDSTAHNNIIASGDSTTHTMIPGTLGMTGNTFVGGNLQIATDLQHIGDTTTKISFHNDGAQIDFLTENGSRIDINNSGVRLGGANSRVTTILDEDAMGTNSNTALATQQSIKAYVDASHPAESDTLQTVTSRGATSNVAITLSNTLTVGVDDTGHDVKFFGATAGKYMLWDEDQDSLFFPDDTKIVLGTGSDTEIQQTGSETIIKDASTGNIKLRAGTVTIQNGAASKTMAVFNGANSVDLHYNNTKKFETTNTGIQVTGAITGAKHILRSMAFYVNDNPMVQNSLYFGSALGNTPSNWQDPQAVGGTISAVASFTIIEDDMNWGILLPFDISKVEVECSLRPNLGTGDDFTIAMYTGIRSNNSNTALTLTKVAIGQTTFTTQRYVTNDITYTADLNAGTMIYVGVGSEDATAAKNARGLMNIVVTER